MCAGFIVVIIVYFILPSGTLCFSLYKEPDTQKLGQKYQEQFCESLFVVLEIDSFQRLDGFGNTVEESDGTGVCPFLMFLMEHCAVELTSSGVWSI